MVTRQGGRNTTQCVALACSLTALARDTCDKQQSAYLRAVAHVLHCSPLWSYRLHEPSRRTTPPPAEAAISEAASKETGTRVADASAAEVSGSDLHAGRQTGRTGRALITGGDSGIGRAVAVLFAREGADVAIAYLPEEQQDAEETRDAIEDAGRGALLLPGDLADRQFCDRVVEDTVRRFGRLDVLGNNAAFQQHQAGLEQLEDSQLEHTFQTNILSFFRVTRAALRHLKSGAAIINTGSITGLEGSEQLLRVQRGLELHHG